MSSKKNKGKNKNKKNNGINLSKKEKEFLKDTRELIQRDYEILDKPIFISDIQDNTLSAVDTALSVIKELHDNFINHYQEILRLKVVSIKKVSELGSAIALALGTIKYIEVKKTMLIKALDEYIAEYTIEDMSDKLPLRIRDEFKRLCNVQAKKITNELTNEYILFINLAYEEVYDSYRESILKVINIDEINNVLLVKSKNTEEYKTIALRKAPNEIICTIHGLEFGSVGYNTACVFEGQYTTEEDLKKQMAENMKNLRDSSGGFNARVGEIVTNDKSLNISYDEVKGITIKRKEEEKLYSYKELNTIAKKNGYQYSRSNGDHAIYVNEKGKVVVIPQGRIIGAALQKKILYNLGVLR